MPTTRRHTRALAIGEVLWDLFGHSARLGGAPLNFTAHLSRMGNDAILISAVGDDDLGNSARAAIEALGLRTRFIRTNERYPTGTASVRLGADGQPSFAIARPAAYDGVELSADDMRELVDWAPGWLYYGTLLLANEHALDTFLRLAGALPAAIRFYDVNLRPNSYTPELVKRLLGMAGVVKLNEEEMSVVAGFTGLPGGSIKAFFEEGAARFAWQAACVTLGAKGCAVSRGGEYAEAPGCPVEVADAVGAGDAFAAALLHGLAQQWPAGEIAAFANRVGAIVASRPGGIPEWSLSEALP